MKKITIHFTVNHEPVTVEVEPNHRLIDVLRNNLGLTSVKEGCSEGECGACTVIYNGEPVTSCCTTSGWPSLLMPSSVMMSAPSACPARMQQLVTGSPL